MKPTYDAKQAQAKLTQCTVCCAWFYMTDWKIGICASCRPVVKP